MPEGSAAVPPRKRAIACSTPTRPPTPSGEPGSIPIPGRHRFKHGIEGGHRILEDHEAQEPDTANCNKDTRNPRILDRSRPPAPSKKDTARTNTAKAAKATNPRNRKRSDRFPTRIPLQAQTFPAPDIEQSRSSTPGAHTPSPVTKPIPQMLNG